MLDNFKATLGKRGFAKPTMFRVEITRIPNNMLGKAGIGEISKDLHFFAESAEFPGTQILTQEHRYYDMPQKFAYAKAHDELNLTFRLDRDFQVKKFFDSWENTIYNRETGDVAYKNAYTGTIQIFQVMENGDSSYAIELEDVFPTQIAQISLGWDQGGSYSRLPVTMTFKRIRYVANKNIFPRTPQPSFNGSSTQLSPQDRTINETLQDPKVDLKTLKDQSSEYYKQIKVPSSVNLVNGLID